MTQIKLGLERLNVPAKIQYLRRFAAALENNPYFTTPSPTRDEILAEANALENSYNDALAARLVSKSKTTQQDDQSVASDFLITRLANYVENLSGGDPTKIESAGFAVRATPTPIGELPAPTDLQVLPSEHSGSADVTWKSVYGAKTYLIERAEDAAVLEYKLIGTSTKKAASLNSMVSGKKYWFRVAAIGSAGQSAWSDPVPLFAP